jgi:hypothetical protein
MPDAVLLLQPCTLLDLILRSGLQAASRRMNGTIGASWFETREDALLTMRNC